MVLEKDEYRIDGDGIWISKVALEECRDHYRKVAEKFKPRPKKQGFASVWSFYIGKANMCIDLLKHFEQLEL